MTDPSRDPQSTPSGPDELLVTVELLRRAKQGDARALEVLTGRYLPRLQRWASGRLPAFARSLTDTSDVVQDTLLKAIAGLDGIEVRGPGGFQAYLRQAVLNRIPTRSAGRAAARDRKRSRIGCRRRPSPLEHAVGADMLERPNRRW
jgi:RNA polymerase sigma-70 factor (ECF subfamily)